MLKLWVPPPLLLGSLLYVSGRVPISFVKCIAILARLHSFAKCQTLKAALFIRSSVGLSVGLVVGPSIRRSQSSWEVWKWAYLITNCRSPLAQGVLAWQSKHNGSPISEMAKILYPGQFIVSCQFLLQGLIHTDFGLFSKSKLFDFPWLILTLLCHRDCKYSEWQHMAFANYWS